MLSIRDLVPAILMIKIFNISMHERFRFKSKDEILKKALALGFELPFSDDISPLLAPASIVGFSILNRLVVQPMEGYDSETEGSPSALTKRRYLRYAGAAVVLSGMKLLRFLPMAGLIRTSYG